MAEQEGFDLSGVRADVTADLAAIAQAEPPSTEEPAADDDTPSPETAEPTPEPEPDVIEVTAAGQRLKVTRDELIKGYQRDVDYRHKTMQLAEERRAAQAQLEQERTALRQQLLQVQQVMQDPDKLAEAHARLMSERGLSGDDNEVLTLGQMKTLWRHEQERLRAELAENQRQAAFEQQKALAETQYIADLQAHSKALLAKHPILQDVEKIDLLLLSDARDINPTDLQAVKDAMAESAARRAARLEKRLTDHTKMAVVRQAKIGKAAIEPPGAQAPPPSAPRNRPLRIGDADLTAQVIADLVAGSKR